jgi:hypothetical protein
MHCIPHAACRNVNAVKHKHQTSSTRHHQTSDVAPATGTGHCWQHRNPLTTRRKSTVACQDQILGAHILTIHVGLRDNSDELTKQSRTSIFQASHPSIAMSVLRPCHLRVASVMKGASRSMSASVATRAFRVQVSARGLSRPMSTSMWGSNQKAWQSVARAEGQTASVSSQHTQVSESYFLRLKQADRGFKHLGGARHATTESSASPPAKTESVRARKEVRWATHEQEQWNTLFESWLASRNV